MHVHSHDLLKSVLLISELPPECCNWVQVGLTEVQVTPVLQHMRQAGALYANGVRPMHVVVPTLPPEQWPPWSQELVRWGVPLVCKGPAGRLRQLLHGPQQPQGGLVCCGARWCMKSRQAGGRAGRPAGPPSKRVRAAVEGPGNSLRCTGLVLEAAFQVGSGAPGIGRQVRLGGQAAAGLRGFCTNASTGLVQRQATPELYCSTTVAGSRP